jgi:hypothetical protein
LQHHLGEISNATFLDHICLNQTGGSGNYVKGTLDHFQGGFIFYRHMSPKKENMRPPWGLSYEESDQGVLD